MRWFSQMRVLACWVAFAATMQAQQYVFHAYREAEGLKNLAVNALTRDREGFLWVATENGVYRFLGSGFQRFGPEQGIAEVNIFDVVADPYGMVWAATSENLYHWDGQRFQPSGRDQIHFTVPRRFAAEDARHLLVVEKRRLYRLEHDAGGKLLSYHPVFSAHMLASIPDLAQVSSVSVVSDTLHGSQVWIGCGSRLYSFPAGLSAGSPQSGDPAVTQWGEEKGLPGDNWLTVRLDRAGTFWAAGQRRVAAMPKGSASFVDRSIPGSDPESIYGHAPLIEDPQGRILAPAEQGLARWEGTGWRFIGQDNGLERTNYILGMAFDDAGDLWLASRGEGLFHWAGYSDWEGWGYSQGLPTASVWAVAPTIGPRIFIGTEKGPASIDLRSGVVSPLFAGSKWTFGSVSAMGFNPDGSLFVATLPGNILRIDPKTGRAEKTATLPRYIISAFQTAAGNIFFSSDRGIYARARNDPKPALVPLHGAAALLGASTRVEGGCEAPDGSDWFVAGNRLLRFNGVQWSMPPIDGLPTLRGGMYAISCALDGAIWVTGDQTGTWRMTFQGDRLHAWQLEFPAELRSLSPLAVLADRRGWVWVGTDAGLVVWNGRAWRHLTQESGLIWNDVNQGALFAGPDGSIWIGTSGGLAHLLHPEHLFDPSPLPVSVTEIRRGGSIYPAAQPITLPWAALPLRFQISSPVVGNRSELVFKYRMEGLHPDWIESGDGVAVFSNLPPGSYAFTAIASNPGLNASSIPVNVAVRILPPWWRSNWFFALCGLAVLLLLVAADRLRAERLRRQSRALKVMVTERTLELEDRTRQLESSRELLRIQASHDGLTGLLNHEAVLHALDAEMDRAQRESRNLVVAMADLDHFKRINDRYGHLAGDQALRSFAAAVRTATRIYDHAGRYGGEEFLLVLTEIPRDSVEPRLDTLHASISNIDVRSGGSSFKIACSIGATVFDPAEGFVSAEALLLIADQALFAAKEAGRNRVVFRAASSLESAREISPRH